MAADAEAKADGRWARYQKCKILVSNKQYYMHIHIYIISILFGNKVYISLSVKSICNFAEA